MLKLATTFSGIGAIEHALKRMRVKHELVFACDNDPHVKESFFANYDIDQSRWFDLVQDIDGKKFKGKVDLLVGGTPCQSFSMVGKRRGFEDARGTLFYEFARLVNEIKPKAFIFENVKGLLSHDSGKTWEVIQSTFKKLGYSYFPHVLNAKDYGIPQNRERLFVVGFRKKKKFNFPDPVELKITMHDLLDDTTENKYYLPEKGIKFVTKQKNIDKRYTQINGQIALCQKANQQFNWHGDFIFEPAGKVDEKYFLSDKVAKYVLATGTKNFYSKPETDLNIARPLLATMAKMHRAGVDNYITRSGRIRKLSPRECLRLMGFDDSFKIIVSDTQMYKQAGNSIVVNVLMAVLRSMGINSTKINL
ncbi:MAG: DNA cytosine methyltransferase [Smithella sp.]|nr:DNA cytosine methyltransferase [Smithella sp.]MDD5527616.1 DNA cytosine methyltransferase [Patescibacteria group bacterium]